MLSTFQISTSCRRGSTSFVIITRHQGAPAGGEGGRERRGSGGGGMACCRGGGVYGGIGDPREDWEKDWKLDLAMQRVRREDGCYG